MVRSGVHPTTHLAYRKGLGTCDALLCTSHAMQSTLENRFRLISETFRLISAHPLIGSTIREFSISSVLWVLKVLCSVY